MPAWTELLTAFNARPRAKKDEWLKGQMRQALQKAGSLRGGRNVILYGSAFLQKPQAPAALTSITFEDLNALMSVVYGMDAKKGLLLILHTQGGITNATETFVAYLRSTFAEVEVAVPTFAMSAGTMISLAADRIIMGRQSQLGPIDPQFSLGTQSMSARTVVEQFNMAKSEILADVKAAHVWAPILQGIGPALLKEALDAIDYSERMVRDWLTEYMFAKDPQGAQKAKAVASHFNDSTNHGSHGRRIDRDEARSNGVIVEDMETSQDLQDAILSAYHAFTIMVEQSSTIKLLVSDADRIWLKSFNQEVLEQPEFHIPVEFGP